MSMIHTMYIRPSVIFVFAVSIHLSAQSIDPLRYDFDKKYGQVEVGGPFVGIEFHHSAPLPSRISFYYPVANSIDLSTDYWKRDLSRPMAIGIQSGSSQRKWIGREGWKYSLSPHKVTFYDRDSLFSYSISYEFCMKEPAAVFHLTIKNESRRSQNVTAYTHLMLALRTCQTYTRIDSAQLTYLNDHQAVVAHFNDVGTQTSDVFVMNQGATASGVWDDADAIGATDDGSSEWINGMLPRTAAENSRRSSGRAIAAYEYRKKLQPGQKLDVIQLIGSSEAAGVEKNISRLSSTWKRDVRAYEEYVADQSMKKSYFSTGDQQVDRSIQWAKAILASNAHYINGTIQPMPCPAEYNFFFSHDVLMTNLGAVNFDPGRVKKNLLYITSLAKDSIIPHAYYWRDDGFKTEMCTPSNWNHLWFIEVSSSYLRHSLDTATIRTLFPFIQKSLSEVLTQRKQDNLMYAYRPDWWDIGWKEGPRTYITALTIRAIEDYLFIASFMDNNNPELPELENIADNMRTALPKYLWDDSMHYLINYNDGDKDDHVYMGSLIAPAYHLLDPAHSRQLLETAKRVLLASDVGIRAVMPPDFDTDSSIHYFKFAGDEAGKPYTYINGGVWPHNNAWYAIALNAVGKSQEALSFVKQTMTLDGVAHSPNGLPAMYEYRYSNPSSSRYGEIDKPSFLWAGGFYLYSIYSLAGLTDTPWNLSVAGHHADFNSSVHCSYSFGTMKDISVRGSGSTLHSILSDNSPLASQVIPIDQKKASRLSITYGNVASPYLGEANAIVHSVEYNAPLHTLRCTMSSFKRHRVMFTVISAAVPKGVYCRGDAIRTFQSTKNPDNTVTTAVRYVSDGSNETITVRWTE